MAATLKEKAKKAITNFTGSKDQESTIFHTDFAALKQWQSEIDPVIEAGNIAIMAMSRFYPIDTIEEFFRFLDGPVAFYKFKHKLKHSAKFEEFEKMGAELNITIPEDFESVAQAAARAKRYFDTKRKELFTLLDGEIVLTEAYYTKRNSKCYHSAEGAEEIERLNYCLEVIAAIEKLEPILARNKKMEGAIKSKKYFLPLPYFLKLVATPTGTKVIPSPVFVKHGFSGSAHLGIYIPTQLEKDLKKADATPKLGPKLKKVRVIDHTGMPTGEIYLVDEKDVEKYMMGPFRLNRNELCPGWFSADGEPWGTPLKANRYAANGFIETLLNNHKA